MLAAACALITSSGCQEASRATVLRQCCVAIGTLLYSQNETYRKAAFEAGLLDALADCNKYFNSNSVEGDGGEVVAELNGCVGQ